MITILSNPRSFESDRGLLVETFSVKGFSLEEPDEHATIMMVQPMVITDNILLIFSLFLL